MQPDTQFACKDELPLPLLWVCWVIIVTCDTGAASPKWPLAFNNGALPKWEIEVAVHMIFANISHTSMNFPPSCHKEIDACEKTSHPSNIKTWPPTGLYSPQNDFNEVNTGSPKLTPMSNWLEKVSMLDEWEVSSYMREIFLAFAHGPDKPCPRVGKCESINIPWGASNVCEGLSGQLL